MSIGVCMVETLPGHKWLSVYFGNKERKNELNNLGGEIRSWASELTWWEHGPFVAWAAGLGI